MEIFGGVISLLSRVLDARAMRHEILAANVANADTPGYKAVDLVFEEELQRAVRAGGGLGMTRTHPRHLLPMGATDRTLGRVEASPSPSRRMDGNTVDMEREMVKLVENSLMYEATAQMLAKKFRGLRDVIREGR